MERLDRVAEVVTAHSRAVLLAALLLSALLGAGVTTLEPRSRGGFDADSTAAAKLEYIDERYPGQRDGVEVVQVVVRNESGNALSKASLLRALRYQRELRANETVNRTLAADRGVFGVANLVAIVALRDPDASLRAQERKLESMSQSDVEGVLTSPVVVQLLEREQRTGQFSPRALFPSGYEPGDPNATSWAMVVVQNESAIPGGEARRDHRLQAAQRTIQTVGQQQPRDDYLTVGRELMRAESTRAIGESLALLGPLALLFALVALAVAYRDPLDVALSWAGIVLVLVWTFGLVGWIGLPFDRGMIIVPILLTGLSIDYAIHVVMRYRERRTGRDPRAAMGVVVGSVGVALAWVTVTTGMGFLSNVASSFAALRAFGLAAALGIAAAFVVFTTVVPAAKVEAESLLERAGFTRDRRAIGSAGPLGNVLSVGYTVARVRPVGILLVVLVASAGVGGYGMASVDSSFDRVESLPQQPPEWMDAAPAPLAPGSYATREHLTYVNAHFQREQRGAQLLVEGNVTSPDTLERLHRAQQRARRVSFERNGESAIVGPLSVIERVAARNETVNETVHAADTDGNGVPDRNLAAVYDALFGAAPERARRVVERTDDGRYVSLRLVVPVDGESTPEQVTRTLRESAAVVDGGSLTATATGRDVVLSTERQELLDGMVRTLALTALAILVFLVVIYRRTADSATLGAVTFAPVVLGVLWLFATLYLLDIPLTPFTAGVGSMALGLGVDYSIHLGERYRLELTEQPTAWAALRTATAGTGGALLGSTATTTGAFWILSLAILPSLQRFGFLMGLVLVFSFLASVLLFPSMLVVWTRRLAPPSLRGPMDAARSAPADGRAPLVRREFPVGEREPRTVAVAPGETVGVAADTAVEEVMAALCDAPGGPPAPGPSTWHLACLPPRPPSDAAVGEQLRAALGPDEARAARLAARLGLGDRLADTPAALDESELFRLRLGHALATDPDLLAVREPFDCPPDERARRAALFASLSRHGLGLVLVGPEAEALAPADRVVELDEPPVVA